MFRFEIIIPAVVSVKLQAQEKLYLKISASAMKVDMNRIAIVGLCHFKLRCQGPEQFIITKIWI